MTRRLRCLIACECSGRVAYEFAKRGWEAHSADLLPNETADTLRFGNGGTFAHYQGDVRDLFRWDHPVNRNRDYRNRHVYDTPLWDIIIAHPPCTDLSLAGAVWWPQKRADGRQDAAAGFFMEMMNSPSQLVAVENPRGDMTRRYRAPDQYVQPWMFGSPLVKATGLWLKGLPTLVPTHREENYPELFRLATGGGSWRTDKAAGRKAMNAHEDSEGRKNRSKVRSRTDVNLARAMADQWGAFAEEYYA